MAATGLGSGLDVNRGIRDQLVPVWEVDTLGNLVLAGKTGIGEVGHLSPRYPAVIAFEHEVIRGIIWRIKFLRHI